MEAGIVLAARVLPSAGDHDSDRLPGGSDSRWAELHDPAGGCDPARRRDLQPAGVISAARGRARASDSDAAGARPRVAADVQGARRAGARGRAARAPAMAGSRAPDRRSARDADEPLAPNRPPHQLVWIRADGRLRCAAVVASVVVALRVRHDPDGYRDAAAITWWDNSFRWRASIMRCGSTASFAPTDGCCTSGRPVAGGSRGFTTGHSTRGGTLVASRRKA